MKNAMHPLRLLLGAHAPDLEDGLEVFLLAMIGAVLAFVAPMGM